MSLYFKIPFAFLSIFVLLGSGTITRGQVQGLADFKIFLDPGHSGEENMGLYNYSEAEKVLRVALELRDMFENQTDISEVHLCRYTDEDYISLQARTTLANELGVDFYYSIHSDAGSASANSTLMLYGGWREEGQTIEKTPNGGAAYGEILDADLTGATRMDRRGNWPDRNFYLGIVDTHQNQWPYLYVNRTTAMPSLLSEAGFHTNPGQQQLNLNTEWKKLEALSAFRSFLEYKNLDRPEVGVVTGIIYNEETGVPANGVSVSIGNKTYTTDSYETLFNLYSDDPGQLHNGFYWIEGLTPGANVEVVFSSDEYENKTVEHPVSSNPNGRTHENLNFLDVHLTSSVPPVVSSFAPGDDLHGFVPGTEIKIVFSREMDQPSVEQAISTTPGTNLNFAWEDAFTLLIGTGNLDFETAYAFVIDGSVARNSATGQFLDGNQDGTAGGDYEFSITTLSGDMTPPRLISQTPSGDSPAREIRPVIRLVFDEEIARESLTGESIVLTPSSGGSDIPGSIHHSVVKGESVLHFFPGVNLTDGAAYDVIIAAGLEDVYGNATRGQSYRFKVNAGNLSEITVIDDFNGGISGWWQPRQSGSTSGIETRETSQEHEQTMLMESLGSTGSMKLSYRWLEDDFNYIRLFLPPGASQNKNRFGPGHGLQVFVFGDGSGNEFRFMIRDASADHEASPWYSIDWKGWKLVTWDMANDPVHGWSGGDGVIDGDGGFFLDGLHLRRGNGGDLAGNIFFDELRFVLENKFSDDLEGVLIYPNPVSDDLKIEAGWEIEAVIIYSLEGSLVFSRKFDNNVCSMDLSHLPPGIYLVQIRGDDKVANAKIIVKR